MPEPDLLLTKIRNLFQEPQASKLHQVQALWSGYGEIARYRLPISKGVCIAKHIKLHKSGTHPRGWNTEFSHKRKLSSYYNEQNFYANLAPHCPQTARVPSLYECGASRDVIWLIMEDLDAAGYCERHVSANVKLAKLCVSWLANFHATFIKKDISSAWSIGTYWFLSTRPDEWTKMPMCALKEAAQLIDARLNNAQHQTLVHGDAKLANFCFSPYLDGVAAVDFQYAGRGCGVKDLVYFLGSCFGNAQLYDNMPAMVDTYFAELKKALLTSLSISDSDKLENEWRGLIPFAWADFERFLTGWSPNHQKLNDYSKQQSNLALSML